MTQKFEIIFSGLSARKADLILLILASQHIETRVEKEEKTFYILTGLDDKEKAYASVNAYYSENRLRKAGQAIRDFSTPPVQIRPGPHDHGPSGNDPCPLPALSYS